LPRWAARSGNAFTAGGLMGSTRLGNRVPTLSDGTGFGGATGVTKTGSSTNVAASATFSMGLSFGVGTSNGTAGSHIGFLDFNGDGYPHVAPRGSIQPTLQNGVLGAQTIGLPRQLSANDTSQIRQNANDSFNVTLGATTSNQRFDANGFPLGIFSEQASYNISFGGGVQASWGKTGLNYDLIDVNGDGLPDLVQPAAGGGTRHSPAQPGPPPRQGGVLERRGLRRPGAADKDSVLRRQRRHQRRHHRWRLRVRRRRFLDPEPERFRLRPHRRERRRSAR